MKLRKLFNDLVNTHSDDLTQARIRREMNRSLH